MKWRTSISIFILTSAGIAASGQDQSPQQAAVGSSGAVKCAQPSYTTDELNAVNGNNKHVPVSMTLKAIQAGIDCYQKNAAGLAKDTPGATKLLPLSKAVIDLKTVTTSGQTVALSFYVLSVSFGHTKTDTADFAFTYEPNPPPPLEGLIRKTPPQQLTDAIANEMLLAASMAADSGINGMKNTGFVVTLSFGVDWKASGGITLPIQAVTLGGTVSGDKNTTQTVTLSFGKLPATGAATGHPPE